MSERIGVAICVGDEDRELYRRMVDRCGQFRVVDRADQCDAIITDDPATAIASAADKRYVLLSHPFLCPEDTRVTLLSSDYVMPGVTDRFMPSIMQVQEATASGKLGEQGLLRIHDWRASSTINTARVASQIDLACWIFAAIPQNTYAVEREGYVQIHFGFAGGGMAIIDLDSTIPVDTSYYSLSLIGSSGAVYADDHHNTNLLLDDRGTIGIRGTQHHLALAGMIAQFAKTVLDRQGFSAAWGEVESALSIAGRVMESAEQQVVLSQGDDLG